jgi:translation initiation factor 1
LKAKAAELYHVSQHFAHGNCKERKSRKQDKARRNDIQGAKSLTHCFEELRLGPMLSGLRLIRTAVCALLFGGGTCMCFQTSIPALSYGSSLSYRRHAAILTRHAATEDDLRALAEKLKQSMNSLKGFDDLEPENKRAKLQHFMDLTGTKDKVVAEAKLENYGWNVEQAAKDGKTYSPKKAVPEKKKDKNIRVAIAKAAVERGAFLPTAKTPVSRCDYVCRIEVSKNGRGGKTVTVINGLEILPVEDKKALLKKLKSAVAGGGNIGDNGNLEVQGEHAETLHKIMVAEGFTDCKISGGIPKKKK